MPTPLAHTYDEKLDLEIGWRLPLTKYLENPLLGILILYGRTLRALEPADHISHVLLLFCKCVAHNKRHRRDLAQFTRLRVAQIPCYGSPETIRPSVVVTSIGEARWNGVFQKAVA